MIMREITTIATPNTKRRKICTGLKLKPRTMSAFMVELLRSAMRPPSWNASESASGGAELWFDAAFGYLQVFTVDDLHDGLAAVAIEPMTCPADAFNSGVGLIIIQPGGYWSGSWGITPLDR